MQSPVLALHCRTLHCLHPTRCLPTHLQTRRPPQSQSRMWHQRHSLYLLPQGHRRRSCLLRGHQMWKWMLHRKNCRQKMQTPCWLLLQPLRVSRRQELRQHRRPPRRHFQPTRSPAHQRHRLQTHLQTSHQTPKEQPLRWYLLCALTHAHTHTANMTHAKMRMNAGPGYTERQCGHEQTRQRTCRRTKGAGSSITGRRRAKRKGTPTSCSTRRGRRCACPAKAKAPTGGSRGIGRCTRCDASKCCARPCECEGSCDSTTRTSFARRARRATKYNARDDTKS